MPENKSVLPEHRLTEAEEWALWNQVLNHLREIAGLPQRSPEDNPYKKDLLIAPKVKKSRLTEKIMDFYQQGLTDSEIAEKIGGSRPQVRNWRNRQGLPVNKRIIPEPAKEA